MSVYKDEQSGQLKAGAMGWVGAAALGAIIMSPAGAIYFNFGPMITTAGPVVPFIFILAMVASLPTAISFAMISKELPSAGSIYSWVADTFGSRQGTFIGWILTGFYVLAMAVLPGVGALFFNEILQVLGLHVGFGTWAIGVLLMTGAVVLLNYYGVELSLKGTILLMAFESVMLFALAITIFIIKGSHGELTAGPLIPKDMVGGTAGLFGALIFGIQANVGYDAIATLGEETKSPKRYIPLATLVALIGVGIYWVIVSWAFSLSAPVSQISNWMSSGLTPIVPISSKYWGYGSILITVTAFTSITGGYLSQTVGTGRVLFAMSRDGVLPKTFGRIHPKFQVPRNAMTLGLIVTVIINLGLGLLLGMGVQYNWTGTFDSFLGLLVYLAVNITNIVFYIKYRRQQFNWFLNGLIPAFGAAIVVYILWNSYFVGLWGAGWEFGRSVQVAVIVWIVLGLLYAVRRKSSKKQSVTEAVNSQNV